MGTRKNISVNLRDLQRVMSSEPENPPAPAVDAKTKFGAVKTFEYNLSTSRWGNEENDDDFDDFIVDKTEQESGASLERSSLSSNSSNRRLRSTPSLANKTPSPATLTKEQPKTTESWRSTTLSADSTDSWRSTKNRDTNTYDASSAFNKDGPRTNRDFDFSRETFRQSDRRQSRFRSDFSRNNDTAPSNNRFSCLDDDSGTANLQTYYTLEPPKSRGSGFSGTESPTHGSFSRSEVSSRSSIQTDSKFGTKNEVKTTGAESKPKTGLFVPSYKRNQKQEDSVEDIFKKAAGITELSVNTPDPEKVKKDLNEQHKQVLLSKRNEIIKHNRLFQCSPENVKAIESLVDLLLGGKAVEDFADVLGESEDLHSIVPFVVTCLVVSKNCESCTTLSQVHEKFEKVSKWLLFLLENNDDTYPTKLLTEIAKFLNQWEFPALSNSLYLLEAVFDSLYTLKIVSKEDFIQWFERDIDEAPNRLTVLIQTMAWKKWLTGEGLEESVAEEGVSDEEDEEDIDIEALVPKPIRLTKGMKY
ncbi:conserved hypothetical protein [Theileria equi strain WA]|uniref:W2 domain-containing protein n=1 Tax=Theileria equi strain WA TaxID=1537102 RepID=L1LCM5_THEEQ|nr:conserved hypothetical protein [Theileria equi strain WA]EKX73187.1 conserved hypothetical protein [Theileria equi strain WA]|eukprot:XP_004832639.1 conserved hypothetical protein [Theileria equi strain WA]